MDPGDTGDRRGLLRGVSVFVLLVCAATVTLVWLDEWEAFFFRAGVRVSSPTREALDLAQLFLRPSGMLLGLALIAGSTLLPVAVSRAEQARRLQGWIVLLPLPLSVFLMGVISRGAVGVYSCLCSEENPAHIVPESIPYRRYAVLLWPGLVLLIALLGLVIREWTGVVRHVIAQPPATAYREALRAAVLAFPLAVAVAPIALWLAPRTEPTGLLLVTPGVAVACCVALLAWGAALGWRLRAGTSA